MMLTGIVMTGYGALGTGALPTTVGMLDFGAAAAVLAAVVAATLAGGFAALCFGAMRQLAVPSVRGVHGPASVARVDRTPNLANAA